jgi:hypothetical protein
MRMEEMLSSFSLWAERPRTKCGPVLPERKADSLIRSSPKEVFAAMVLKRMEEKDITYGEALSEVARDNVDLANAYRRAVINDEPK